MEFQRGERVNLNFDTGTVEKLEPEEQNVLPMPSFPAFVGDIQERDSSSANPPVAPSPKPNVNGFPAHKKRTPRVSAFKQQRAAKEKQAAAAPRPNPQSAFAPDPDEERRAIDEENRRTIAAMSDAEIEQERQELMASLNPALLQKLLLRSNIDQGSNERDFDAAPPAPTATTPTTEKAGEEIQIKATITKRVSFAASEPADESKLPESTTAPSVSATETSSDAVRSALEQQTDDSIHFPRPPQPPDLDPNDPAFLKNLHEKYFPNLAYDPSKLSWMSPIDPSDKKSPYHPSQTALNPAEIRFDFEGNLLAPSVAREIPTDRGLHHHAEAPEAAGYTIPELAVTARSKVPSQRCIAYQTLGRILYRLGKGQFGVESAQKTDGPVRVAKNPDVEEDDDDVVWVEEDVVWVEEDVGSAIAGGLWQCIEEGRVIETLTEEANKERGHLTARTFAQEALWNWRRGGGRRRHAV